MIPYAFIYFFIYFLCPLFIFHMTFVNIGTFNINGCRGTAKRAALLKADIILLQETHTDLQNQAHWVRDWKGYAFLSHGTNLNAGVAMLFSSRIGNQPSMVEIMPGRILRVEITLGEIDYTFFNVYAPSVGQERVIFFGKLSDALLQCPQDNVVVMGGDFNCTINAFLDRNHDEPHPVSAGILKNLIDYHDCVDLWRVAFPGVRQYTWLKKNSNTLSGARLDRFYVRKRHRDRFFNSCISPSFLSDHHYCSVSVSVVSSKIYKSQWHFNNRLLQDHNFLQSFTIFWESWREERNRFQSLSQWWDIGKVHIKIFCQQLLLKVSEA